MADKRQSSETEDRASSISIRRFNVARFLGISFCAWGRTTSGTRTLPMPSRFKIDGYGQAGARFAQSLDGEIYGGADRSVDAANSPGSGRGDVGQLRGHASVGPTEATGGQTFRTRLRGPGSSRWPSTTPSCHSWNRVGSVA
jgi:hypothetical protein